jgi:DNA-binding response OmpR family regulator
MTSAASTTSIVLIDDDRYNTSLYEMGLTRQGFRVTVYRDPDEALQALMGEQPGADLVILDLSMPPKGAFREEPTHGGLATGVLLFDRLRKRHSQLPIVILTNVIQDEILDKLYQGESRPNLILRKLDCGPLDLPDHIRDVLAEG